jgi:hypothetical protein|tara:strand:+ start:65 stop:334 length:270 start_codon:yes stop_codon:yes gene_type:complete
MTSKKRKIIEKINNLTIEFARFEREGICKTDSDYEYLEEHLDKAFACVPRSSEFPSQLIVSELNKQIIIKATEGFFDSLSEGLEENEWN